MTKSTTLFTRIRTLFLFLTLSAIASLLVIGIILSQFSAAKAAGTLTVEIIAGYNLVVDSNVLSPSTHAPSVATVIGKFCNTGDASLTDVHGFIGDYIDPSNSTPGVYPSRDSSTFAASHPSLLNTGIYSFTHVGGSTGTDDATRYIGTLSVDECKVQYWHFTYPRTNPAETEPVWGETNDPNDDLWLQFDIWGTSSDSNASATHTMTMRNEISAMANKIEPNPSGRWFNTDTDTIRPGEVITSNGVLYTLGNINKGFDNDGDYIYDYNAWLQPIGDPSYDPSCFRLIRTTGVLTVSRSGGKPDMVISFVDQLYFTNLPTDNNGAIGNVHYTFLALGGPCSTTLTPYQEVASGADNEKFNADYGAGIPPVGSYEAQVTVDKSSYPNVVILGETITYTIPFQNDGDASAGLPLNSMPLVISDTIPAGSYVSGTISYTFGSDVTILYSTDNGSTWSATEPSPAISITTIQWQLSEALAPGSSGSATFQVTVPGGYSGSPFIENTACASLGGGITFDCASITTVVSGTNSIGDKVWQDDDGDGIQGGGETGIDNITVSLYWDKNGDETLDSDDVLVYTETTSGGGGYTFTYLPDGNFLVQVDNDDADLPSGYSSTTAETYAVSLDPGSSDSNPVNDLDADFGFGPVLSLDKQLTSGDPAYEGDQVIYTIDLVNTRPGNGTGQGAACTYTTWSGSGTSGGGWDTVDNAFGSAGPDGLYAVSTFSGNPDDISGPSTGLGTQLGDITSVELIYSLYLDTSQGYLGDGGAQDDQILGRLSDAGEITTIIFSNAYLNTNFDGLANQGILSWDITNEQTWTWSNFGNYFVELEVTKNGAKDGAILYLDGLGFRITTDQTCGDSSGTIATLPMTDTYDADKLEFISASPAQDSNSTTGTGGSPYDDTGTVTWSNLGPLYAGQTTVITVTFKALEPSGPTTTITNTAVLQNALYANSNSVNSITDTVTATLQATGSIGDLIWNDNASSPGTYEPGVEDGIPNVTVQLYTDPNGDGDPSDGVVTATQVTDSNGGYLFEGVRDGDYVVVVDTSSLPNGGTGAANTSDKDSDYDSDSGPINISGSNDVADSDFGYTVPTLIEGTIWHDRDQSGTSTTGSGEEGLAIITVYAFDGTCTYPSAGNPCNTAATDANGDFTITGVTSGTYTVTVDTSSGALGSGGWTQSYDIPNGPDGIPGSGDDIVALDHKVPVKVITGGVGEADYSYYQTGSTSIGDTLYRDWDGDGVEDSGEDGIPNVTISLYEDEDGDGVIDSGTDALIATTSTLSNGSYSFTNLLAYTYTVGVDESDADLPGSYSQTGDPDEAGACSTCDARGSAVTTSGNVSDIDFGYWPRGYSSIGDFVWTDTDGDGIQDSGESGINNILVSLYEDSNDDGTIDSGDALVITTTTNDMGAYSFTHLPAGDYLVDVDTSDSDLPTDGANRYVLSTGNDLHDVTLATAQDYTSADFGFTAGGTIGDFIWQDNDGDGSQDSDEPGVANVTVTLYNDVNSDGVYDSGTDTQYGTDTTDSDGLYEFSGLPAGDYVVVVYSDDNDLPSSTVTGDPDENGTCSTCDGESGVTLSAGQTDRSRDFGFQTPGVIGDFVWLDMNGNGAQDSGEPGIGSVALTLTLQSSTEITTTTNSDGYYSFGNVANGTHSVEVDTSSLPIGLAASYDQDSGTISPDDQSSVEISGGVSDLTIDFGYQYSGSYSISGTVFHDVGGDGGLYTPGNGDTPYSNINLYLWKDSKLIGKTSTDSGGDYTFSSLPDGDYTVAVNEDATNLTGTSRTTPGLNAYYSPVTIIGGNEADKDFGFVSQVDMGDLPSGYSLTTLDDDGARHTVGGLYLGSSGAPDTDADGQESTAADGDDNDGNDDDDGVVPTGPWSTGTDSGSVSVTVGGCSGTCYLSAWIDWGQDNGFSQTGDRILLDYPVSNGSQAISFDIPVDPRSNIFNARFRLYESSTGGRAQATGLVSNGEVEDYQWEFSATAVRISALNAFSENADLKSVAGFALAALLVLGTASLLAHTRKLKALSRVDSTD